MNQEKIVEIQMIEHEVENLNNQMKLIEQNTLEMNTLFGSLEEIEKKDTKEILVNIGKRVYIPVEIKEKNLIVDIGKNSLVRKSVKDTKKVVNEQIKKLSEGKEQILERLEQLQEHMDKLLKEFEDSKNGEGGV